MKQEEIEMQLWEYIDGICNEADAARISALINKDSQWQHTYASLIALQAEIAGSIDLEQPSLRFTKNVMEAVAAAHIAPATKRYINPLIIRGIAAFFLIIMGAVFVYALAHTNWSAPSSGSMLSYLKIDYGALMNSPYFDAFIMVNIVLGLALVDKVLRGRRKYQNR